MLTMSHPGNSATPATENIPEHFLWDIINSTPGASVIIKAGTTEIVFANRQFRNEFDIRETENGEKVLFTDLIAGAEQEKLMLQLQQVGHHADILKKYFVYNIKNTEGNTGAYYVYANPLNSRNDNATDYYHLLILSEKTRWDLPYLSSDSREVFLQQFNKVGFGTFEWILGCENINWSKGVYKVYELEDSSAEITYEFADSFTHPEDKALGNEIISRLLETGEDYEIQLRIITARHNMRYVKSLGRLIKDNNGKPIKIVGTIEDVTERVQAEQNLQKNVEELNRSNKELEEFAYVASHDMQEPLRKIMTFCGRLAEKYREELAPEGSMYIDRAIASAENMRTLINNLLDFSRITKSEISYDPTNLNIVLKEVKSELELLIEETGTLIRTDNLPVIAASFPQMKQLFSNIINNAIKFRSPERQQVISIQAAVLPEAEIVKHHLNTGKVYHRISISDTGIGFDEIYASRIFQIFQRLHGKAEYPGSGIGLAICKKIIDRHDGVIYAEGVIDKGASFVFILPEKH